MHRLQVKINDPSRWVLIVVGPQWMGWGTIRTNMQSIMCPFLMLLSPVNETDHFRQFCILRSREQPQKSLASQFRAAMLYFAFWKLILFYHLCCVYQTLTKIFSVTVFTKHKLFSSRHFLFRAIPPWIVRCSVFAKFLFGNPFYLPEIWVQYNMYKNNVKTTPISLSDSNRRYNTALLVYARV